MDDVESMTGERNFNAPRPTTLDELKLVGKSMENPGGFFKLTHMTQPMLKGDDGKERYPSTEIREPITLVPLIVRRRLVETSADGFVRWTSEHSTPDDIVQLFGEGKTKAPASDLRDRHENLRTEQVVYCRIKGGQIVRLRIKGLSLKPSSSDEAKRISFYEYLQSFREPDHFWQYQLTLVPVEAEAKKGTNWAIDFRRGERLTEEQVLKVIENIKEIYADNKKIDDHYAKTAAGYVPVTQSSDWGALGDKAPDYPKEEIDPDDIPF